MSVYGYRFRHEVFNQGVVMEKSEQINELVTALAKAQAEMKNPTLDSSNPFFKNKYVSLAGVREAVTPTLAKFGLAVTQLIGHQEGGITCQTVLMHVSGQWLSGTLYMPSGKQDAQGYGSAITYARRYALMAICGVVGDEDDDAEGTKPKPAKVATTTARDAWEELDEKTKNRLMDLEIIVKEHFEQGSVDEAVKAMDAAGLDADEKTAIWSRFDSKQRSAMKRAKQEMSMKAGLVLADQA